MKRRTLLSGVAVGLGGCLGRAAGPGGPGTDTPTDDPDVELQRRVSLAAVDDVSEHGVSIDAELVSATVTSEATARLRVTTTNEGRRRRISVGPGMCCLFNRLHGGSDPAGLWLHRPAIADGIDRVEGTWRRDVPADRERVYRPYACPGETYDHGWWIANEYEVWDDYRADGYLPPGTYRFERTVTVAEPGSDPGTATAFDWGFDLRVERP